MNIVEAIILSCIITVSLILIENLLLNKNKNNDNIPKDCSNCKLDLDKSNKDDNIIVLPSNENKSLFLNEQFTSVDSNDGDYEYKCYKSKKENFINNPELPLQENTITSNSMPVPISNSDSMPVPISNYDSMQTSNSDSMQTSNSMLIPISNSDSMQTSNSNSMSVPISNSDSIQTSNSMPVPISNSDSMQTSNSIPVPTSNSDSQLLTNPLEPKNLINTLSLTTKEEIFNNMNTNLNSQDNNKENFNLLNIEQEQEQKEKENLLKNDSEMLMKKNESVLNKLKMNKGNKKLDDIIDDDMGYKGGNTFDINSVEYQQDGQQNEEDQKVLKNNLFRMSVGNRNIVNNFLESGGKYYGDILTRSTNAPSKFQAATNELKYGDFNYIAPLNKGMINPEYTFVSPTNWYPIPPHPPVCVTNKSCTTCPIIMGDGKDYMQFASLDDFDKSRRFTGDMNINVDYIKNVLNNPNGY
jgi:hypothetical protein